MKKLVTFLFLSILINSISLAQLSGTYYIGAVPGSRPGGGDPEFARLGKAFDSLNAVGINGPCTFYFLDEDYTEATNIALACTGTSSTNTILFKPYTGVTPNIHFTQLSDNVAASGRIIFGTNSTASWTLVTMNYVTFDGSNSVGGTTRDLSITEVDNIVTFQFGIRVVGDVNNFTLKNVKITLSETESGSSYGILVTPRNQDATDYIPDNITVDNCEINITGGIACQGISIGASGTLLGPNYPSGIVFRKNKIIARTRGIFLSTGTGDVDIHGNEIYINQTNTGALSQGIFAFSVGSASKIINIYNNKFLQLQSANSSVGDFGIVGIQIAAQGVYNIYNNLITNFSTTTVTTDPSCVIEGIRVLAATVNGITTNIYHNTVVIPDLSIIPGTGAVVPKVFSLNMSGASGTRTANVKNNIFSSREDDFTSYTFAWTSNANGSTLVSDYNDLTYTTNGKTGLFGATECALISDWRTAASQDANSISADPLFVSSTDFHLTGTSPCVNAGTNVGITTDLDGNSRPEPPSGTLYDIGAYEFQTQAPAAPVANAATNVSYYSFSANWNSSAGATGYFLDVATDITFTSFVTGYQNKSVGNVLTSSVTGLTPNTPYYYRVRAFNGVYSGYSNSILVTTLILPPPPPAPVANAASNVSYTSFSANWGTSTGATSYLLDVATDITFTTYVTGYQDKNVGNVLTSSVTGLTANTPYYYRVRAFNGSTSTNSNTIACTTLARISYSGNYYIGAPGTGPGGSNPQFADLRAACQALNNGEFTGSCTFFITSNITETLAGVGLAINPDPYTVTFKPYTGVQPTITLQYPSDANSGPSGAFVIGIPMENNIAWNDLRVTKNIVFDGSNTPSGTSRDLTITNQTTSHRNAFPMAIVGNVSNITIKNCKVYYTSAAVSTSGNLFVAAIQLRARLQLGLDWAPSNITIENNHINANFAGNAQTAEGIVTTSTAPTPITLFINNLVIKNNLIEGKQRAIALAWSANTEIYGNQLILNQNIGGTIANQAVMATSVVAGSTVNIYNNIISSVSSISNGASAGNAAISIESAGTYNVYNNMIFGFNLAATNPTAFLRGIAVTSSTATAKLYHNTIYMDNIASIGTGTVAYNGLYLSNGANNVKNNIIVSAETDFTTYCINRPGTTGTLTSNYNNFYPENATNGNVGFWNVAAAQTLSAWQTASSQDANSKSVSVTFASATDLHLSGGSIGDGNLASAFLTGVTTDIDGDTRNAYWPYMGADEVTSSPLALQLNLKTLIQGFYAGSVNDTISVFLAKPVAPYTRYNVARGLSSASGVNIYLPKTNNETSYYVGVKHRNSVETWSGSTISTASFPTSYDFTDAQIKAFGSNMIQVLTKWCFYGGDVNQDGVVDITDVGLADTDNLNFVSGYVVTDVTGDQVVDITDVSLIDSNNLNFVSKQTPGGVVLGRKVKSSDNRQMQSKQ